MASGGAGAGEDPDYVGGPVCIDSSHAAGRLRAIANETGLYGEFILAGLDRIAFPIPDELPPRGYYLHSGHGAETAMNNRGRTHKSRVPVGCAYMTNVQCGEVLDFGVEDKSTMAYLSGKSPSRLPLLDKCIEGDRVSMLKAKVRFNADDLVSQGGEFITSHFLPYFTYEDVEGSGVYTPTRSGLLPYGTNMLEKGKPITKYTEEDLRFMYRDSVFPTFEMVMASGVDGFMGGDEPNISQVEGHLDLTFRCSSEALMLRFPGFHAHSVCRVAINSSVYRHEERRRVAKTVARELIAAGFQEAAPSFPLIMVGVDSCLWGGDFPDRPADLRHPGTWTTAQRDYATRHGQREYVRKLKMRAAAGGAGAGGGGGGAAAAGGAGGGGAKRQRTLRNRRSRRQRKTRRKTRQ